MNNSNNYAQTEQLDKNLWSQDDISLFSVVERQREIYIPKDVVKQIVEKLINNEISSKICALEKKIQELKNQNSAISISDSAAEEVLRDALKQLKEKNIQEVDIIDLYSKTKLPIEQIGKIMSKLELEGVVSENGKDN